MLAPDATRLLASVDADRLMAHVAELTRYVRTPGGADEAAAFAYIEKELALSGLAPQRHNLPAYVSLPSGASLCVEGEPYPCTTHSMLPGADIEAEIVFIPDAAAIGKNALAGKIVMTEGLAMVPVMRAAMAARAAGVVFIAGEKHFHEMIVSQVWGSPEPSDLNAYMTIPAVTVAYAEGERIKTRLLQPAPTAGGTRAKLHASLQAKVDSIWTTLPVLTADIGDTAKGFLLLTGHVDSWHRGAMDNASGNAAALEIARLLTAEAAGDNGSGGLRRGVRVVFWSGHSHGRYAGSTAYCDAFFQELYDKAFLHVNVDCLGGTGATLLTQAACMAETKELGAFAIGAVTGETFEGVRFGRSCDQSFWGTGTPSLFSSVSEQPKPEREDAAAKAFALMFGGSKSGGYGWWWHTVADTADKLDPAFLRRDTQIFLAAVHKACTDPLLPLDITAAFNDFASIVRRYAAMESPLVDFGPLLREVRRGEALVAELALAEKTPDAANALIMEFERRLVPLAYVKGKIYGHDPALRQAPVPLLEETEDLAREQDPHRRNALAVLLRRRLNEVTHRLGEALTVLERARAGEPNEK